MHLAGHSWFSLRFGVRSPKGVAEIAAKKGIRWLALTDINATSGALDFFTACRSAGVRPILGVDFRRKNRPLFVALARNREGFAEINRFLTDHSLDQKPLPEVAPDGFFQNCFLIYPTLSKPIELFSKNEFLGIRPCQTNALFDHILAKKWQHKLVAFCPATFEKDEKNNLAEEVRLHKILRAIDLNTLGTKLKTEDIARADDVFLDEKEVETAFELFPKLLENTRFLAENCQIELETGLKLNRQNFTGSKDGDFKLLAKLAESGLVRRFGARHKKARERLMKELKVIQELDFMAYFLITWDIVRYAQTAGYHHIGRGSGANSIVAFCLFITDVDPLELDLYFERFINEHRVSPPDFDIDFSWDERDDVTDYIFKRYGRDRTALLATYSTFQMAAAVREVGKVFGLPKKDIDDISDALPQLLNRAGTWNWSSNKRNESSETTESETRDDVSRQPAATANSEIRSPKSAFEKLHAWAKPILKSAAALVDFPNYLSIHAGGVLISEEPLAYSAALQMMPKGFPIVQFDMYAAEDWGFHKFDILSQRGLGHIKDAVDLVKKNQGRAVDVHDIELLKSDEKTREQLRSAQCIGCFYVESPAMRGLLAKLKCVDYVHLVAASSIIRPGVAQSGMMRAYIERFHHPNSFKYLHKVFEEQLGETFGVMVYQEDVMKIVHHFAGLGLDESDVLRRMMTGKKRSSEAFARLQKKYFDNCRERGHPDELAQEVWRQIESFAGYSFCKAHSASYAVESFQSLFLKSHFPLEFMVAVINNFGGFYATEFYVHELRQNGADIRPPCVQNSAYLTKIEGKTVFLGFAFLKGLEQKTALAIVDQRERHGPFRGLTDFVRRVSLPDEQFVLLIRIGALAFTGLSKCALMWEKSAAFSAVAAGAQNGVLFEDEASEWQLPTLEEDAFDQSFDEIELLGFALRSPFELTISPFLEPKKGGFPRILSKNMLENVGKRVEMLGYYVCRKDVRTKHGQPMFFGTWLDEAGRFFDSVHFPISDFRLRNTDFSEATTADNPQSEIANPQFRGKGVYRIWGKIAVDFGFASLEAQGMERLVFRADRRKF